MDGKPFIAVDGGHGSCGVRSVLIWGEVHTTFICTSHPEHRTCVSCAFETRGTIGVWELTNTRKLSEHSGAGYIDMETRPPAS